MLITAAFLAELTKNEAITAKCQLDQKSCTIKNVKIYYHVYKWVKKF